MSAHKNLKNLSKINLDLDKMVDLKIETIMSGRNFIVFGNRDTFLPQPVNGGELKAKTKIGNIFRIPDAAALFVRAYQLRADLCKKARQGKGEPPQHHEKKYITAGEVMTRLKKIQKAMEIMNKRLKQLSPPWETT